MQVVDAVGGVCEEFELLQTFCNIDKNQHVDASSHTATCTWASTLV